MASGQKKKTTTKKTAPQKSALPPIRREVGGGVCLLLALCVVVSYFQADAIVLNLLGNLLKGLAGYGYWLAAPALALAGVNLLAHQGRPVVLRTVCALVLPVLLVFMAIIAADKRVMGAHRSRVVSRALIWVTVGIVTVLTVALLVMQVLGIE